MEHRVNIIVAAYNAEHTINRSLKSIQKQTYKNWKCIIVNDGSTDKSLEICEKFVQKDSRFIVISQENQGAAKAKLRGIKESKDCEYICFCDADDELDKKYLDKLMLEAVKNNADLVVSNVKKMLGAIKFNTFIPECCKRYGVYEHEQIMKNLYISYFGITNLPGYLNGKLYKTELLKLIQDKEVVVGFMADDLCINIQIIPSVKKMVIVPEQYYYYRMGGGTSKFMPTFMQDYYAYHQLQCEMIEKYDLEYKFTQYSDIEIINVAWSWFNMCAGIGKYTDQKLKVEMKRIRELPLINLALINIIDKEYEKKQFLNNFFNKDYDTMIRKLREEMYRRESGIKVKLKKKIMKIIK